MNDYKSVCNKCYRKTWYEKQQPCKVEGCKGTLMVIDESGLDKRFESYYRNGQRIEVTYKWGEKERFYIGKSTGWKPCWLTIKKSNSFGGAGLSQDSVVSIKSLPKYK